MNNVEYRSFTFEGTPTQEAGHIIGRAIVYNSMSKPLKTDKGDSFIEIISKGALTRSLSSGQDIRALCEHNKDMLLGRTSNNTLKLEDREDGLYVDISLPNTSYANDLKEMVSRGDISGFSFGFTQPKQRTYFRGDMRIREITDLNIVEISVVSNPAYTATGASLRSDDVVWEREEATPVVENTIEEPNTTMQKHLNLLALL